MISFPIPFRGRAHTTPLFGHALQGQSDADAEVEAAICLESIRVRCSQSERARYTLTTVLIVVGALLWTEVESQWRLIVWLSLTFGALLWRLALCERVMRRIDDEQAKLDSTELRSIERALFWNVIPLNLSMGAGMWWVASI